MERLGRRARRLGAAAVAIGVVTATLACAAPPPPPPQSTANWRIQANTLTVVDDNNDCFGLCAADEPDLVNLGFRVKFNSPNSASTFVVDDVSNELLCQGGPDNNGILPGGTESCNTGETVSVPTAMGRLSFPNLKLVDVADLAYGYTPEVAGAFTLAYEEDQVFGSGNVADTVASFAGALRSALNSTIAAGTLPADGNAAAQLIVDVIGQVAARFVGNTLLGLLSGLGNADDLIGVAPLVVIGVTGTLASLVNSAGLSSTAVLRGRVVTAGGATTTNVTYTRQTIAGIGLGEADTNYRVSWTLGPA